MTPGRNGLLVYVLLYTLLTLIGTATVLTLSCQQDQTQADVGDAGSTVWVLDAQTGNCITIVNSGNRVRLYKADPSECRRK